MFSASAEEVKVGGGSKYQSAGISEKVTIAEVKLIVNEQYKTKTIQLSTVNEYEQSGLSKRLSLNIVVNPGKSVSAWTVSAKYLLNLLMSTGKTEEDSRKVLNASDENELVKNLSRELVGKSVRGLFSSREYQPGKFAIELYATEPVGGNRLVYDPNNKNHNDKLPKADSSSEFDTSNVSPSSDLPF